METNSFNAFLLAEKKRTYFLTIKNNLTMHILKGIFYATAAWLIIACAMTMFVTGFTVEKFLLIVMSISGILWCYLVKEND